MKKIYVASSWRNNLQPQIVAMLRQNGHQVYDFKNPPNKSGFGWSEIDPNWEHWSNDEYLLALEHDRAIEGFNEDFSAMEWADTFVLVLPCGRSAHLELGWAAGKGKRTCVLLPPEATEPELMVKMCDYIAIDPYDMLEWLEQEPLAGPIE